MLREEDGRPLARISCGLNLTVMRRFPLARLCRMTKTGIGQDRKVCISVWASRSSPRHGRAYPHSDHYQIGARIWLGSRACSGSAAGELLMIGPSPIILRLGPGSERPASIFPPRVRIY